MSWCRSAKITDYGRGSDATRPLLRAPRSLVGIISLSGRQALQTVPHTSAAQAPLSPVEAPEAITHDNLALLRFAHDFAQHYRLDMMAVVDRLCTVPQTFLDLAHDPCGLTALGSMIANELGSEIASPFVVSVH